MKKQSLKVGRSMAPVSICKDELMSSSQKSTIKCFSPYYYLGRLNSPLQLSGTFPMLGRPSTYLSHSSSDWRPPWLASYPETASGNLSVSYLNVSWIIFTTSDGHLNHFHS